jgi:Cu2+-exporting ATPase
VTAPLSLNVVFDIVRSAASTVGGTKVSCRAGEVRIKCPTVFGPGGERWRAFVDRLWRLPEVEAVEIDRRHGTARVRFAKKLSGDRRLLERMSTALSADAAPTAGSPIAGLEEHLAGRRWIRLYRRGAGFSTWELVHELPGRIRVRDVGLRGRTDLVRQLELDLHTLPGVHTVTASATSGSMLVRFDPLAIDRDSLLAALDDTVRFSDLCALARTAPARAGFTLANTTLALATIGEFMFPAVLPASAVLLVATNLAVFRGALGDIRERRVGLPLLHTSIVVGTLATGGFIASSLMSWLLLFWQNRHARRVATARQILGATVRKQHRTAWVCRDGVELETPANRLEPGHVISVRSGELLPVDGKVVSGTALVDEAIVRGTAGLVCRTARQSILRGTLVVEGELCVEVTRCGGDTVAERIGQSLDAATKDTSLSLKHVPPPMAHRAVPPALLTAGVGLMVGDAATAVAIMRPDYATGPEIGGSLLLVHQLGTCLQAGLVVRRAGVFAEMAAVDMVLIDQHLALERRESEVAGVVAPGSLAGSELLRFAECALRGICDPRSFALTAACAARQLTRLDLQAHCRAGHVEIVDRTCPSQKQLQMIGGLSQLHFRLLNGSLVLECRNL